MNQISAACYMYNHQCQLTIFPSLPKIIIPYLCTMAGLLAPANSTFVPLGSILFQSRDPNKVTFCTNTTVISTVGRTSNHILLTSQKAFKLLMWMMSCKRYQNKTAVSLNLSRFQSQDLLIHVVNTSIWRIYIFNVY